MTKNVLKKMFIKKKTPPKIEEIKIEEDFHTKIYERKKERKQTTFLKKQKDLKRNLKS